MGNGSNDDDMKGKMDDMKVGDMFFNGLIMDGNVEVKNDKMADDDQIQPFPKARHDGAWFDGTRVRENLGRTRGLISFNKGLIELFRFVCICVRKSIINTMIDGIDMLNDFSKT